MATVEALEAELAQLGYRELQAMAKEKGLKASGCVCPAPADSCSQRAAPPRPNAKITACV